MPKVIDCVTYFDEDLLLDIRFNELNNFVNYFVVIESSITHQGQPKKLNFDISKFKKFKNKIIYLVKTDLLVDEFKAIEEKYTHNNLEFKREHTQRNYILKSIERFNDNDCILISDADEIPRGDLIEKNFKSNYFFYNFKQKLYYYKLNYFVRPDWHGTVMTAKKNLGKFVSPTNARIVKSPKRKGIRGFFYNLKHNIKIIENGGWHFSYLKSPEGIVKKLESFVHAEYNNDQIKNISYIKDSIKNKKNLFSEQKFIITDVDETYPKYIQDNINKFKEWIGN